LRSSRFVEIILKSDQLADEAGNACSRPRVGAS
jgi:hypothetical protein